MAESIFMRVQNMIQVCQVLRSQAAVLQERSKILREQSKELVTQIQNTVALTPRLKAFSRRTGHRYAKNSTQV
jgi:hypothetical protein